MFVFVQSSEEEEPEPPPIKKSAGRGRGRCKKSETHHNTPRIVEHCATRLLIGQTPVAIRRYTIIAIHENIDGKTNNISIFKKKSWAVAKQSGEW